MQGLILGAAAFFIGKVLYGNWQALRGQHWTLDPMSLLLSYVILTATWLWIILAWIWLLQRFGAFLEWRDAYRIWFLSNIVRYIPGNVWQFLGMVYLCEQKGIGKLQTLASIGMHQALANSTGLLVAMLYYLWVQDTVLLSRVLPMVILLPLAFIALQPSLYLRFLTRVLARVGRLPLTIQFAPLDGPVFGLVYVFSWILYGAAFTLLVNSIYPLSSPWEWPYLTVVFAASYVIGFLSLLTPSGLGVREGVMILLLAPAFSLPVATVISVVSRLWMISGELFGTGVALLFSKRGTPSGEHDRPT